ncbi:MAG TPA: branched-chain-amino-acid transaminase [Sediminibacterium sp.]|uniref:branched-chain-amino-acid transaminase n=1 Tax=Sediminibacterium sp. TaxID=1917865 RepID=UPI0008D2C5E0|nr:branched-chain-amino-acid transaminase [Sediminibacterium sp.]OHC86606.1 MAG: branched-chain-amino-acid transaminase [Sphingobacteriia bacterium RIFOXYC2_FULL_35_18]OHC88537.1 MAG: branched-chain-amino-acid transaminase [Sphingobacteriia bacterium RIFOXYD2_FULL_35_12]HLD52042.1 branched-chain-amino-acid transaminase [Sediminibacterium sp.]
MHYYQADTIIYHNGTFVKATDAKMDLYSQSLHYGYSVFEGIRSYKTTNDSTAIFKAVEHFERLKISAESINLPYSFNTQELIDATYEVLKQNKLGDAYIRPVVYAPANMSFARNTESYVFIEAWEMAPFLGDQLLRIMTSSFQRPNPKAFKIHAKAAGHYVNSILASQEAKDKGYDEAFLLDMNDHAAEGPGANVFFEKDGVLHTPQAGHILAGITRATVLELCSQLNIEVKEGVFSIDDIKQADAAFFCGTAAEVIGWKSLDEYVFPKAWNETNSYKVQQAYKQLVVKPLSA